MISGSVYCRYYIEMTHTQYTRGSGGNVAAHMYCTSLLDTQSKLVYNEKQAITAAVVTLQEKQVCTKYSILSNMLLFLREDPKTRIQLGIIMS